MEHTSEVLDVLIIGAGISGIDAAYRIQTECPKETYAILEARDRIGGTWDLFQYPGIRSDSDVETLGFAFKPWVKEKSIADGASIRQYVEDTAHEFGIDKHIRFGERALSAVWHSNEALWEITCASGSVIRCRFLYGCTGYYDYSQGYLPDYPGREKFRGEFIHPQFWPETFEARGKKIVVIGSGATAVTLVPALAGTAAHVTMLQRSPTFIASRPAIDPYTQKIKKLLPKAAAHRLVRLKNILYGISVYQFAKKQPDKVRALLTNMARHQLPRDYDVKKHFNPRYNPWDQRLCLAPDGDFFASIKDGRADVVTDEIALIEERGLRLKSGDFLEADVIVSATGLKLQLAGGMKLFKDQTPIDLSHHFNYKGVMISDVPNLAIAIGYTNASWTLKCDLTAQYVCRVLNYMDAHGYKSVVPVAEPSLEPESLIDLTSSYIKRAEGILPKSGDKTPWKMHQNYFRDYATLGYGRLDDGALAWT